MNQERDSPAFAVVLGGCAPWQEVNQEQDIPAFAVGSLRGDVNQERDSPAFAVANERYGNLHS